MLPPLEGPAAATLVGADDEDDDDDEDDNDSALVVAGPIERTSWAKAFGVVSVVISNAAIVKRRSLLLLLVLVLLWMVIVATWENVLDQQPALWKMRSYCRHYYCWRSWSWWCFQGGSPVLHGNGVMSTCPSRPPVRTVLCPSSMLIRGVLSCLDRVHVVVVATVAAGHGRNSSWTNPSVTEENGQKWQGARVLGTEYLDNLGMSALDENNPDAGQNTKVVCAWDPTKDLMAVQQYRLQDGSSTVADRVGSTMFLRDVCRRAFEDGSRVHRLWTCGVLATVSPGYGTRSEA